MKTWQKQSSCNCLTGEIQRPRNAITRTLGKRKFLEIIMFFMAPAHPNAAGFPVSPAARSKPAGRCSYSSKSCDAPERPLRKPDHAAGMISGKSVERVARIELARSAWEADRLPLHHTRKALKCSYQIAGQRQALWRRGVQRRAASALEMLGELEALSLIVRTGHAIGRSNV